MSNKEAFTPYGVDLFGDPIQSETKSPVAKKFIIPPFSVLSARDGEWQDRKRAWAAMGIKSELGRMDGMLGIDKQAEWMRKNGDGANRKTNGTSVFDPTLCELIYRWFSCEGAQVVDPFAGGSVRGIVASCLGRKYWGGELRSEQVEANRDQGKALCPEDNSLQWTCGDSMQTVPSAPKADLIFSCPPYGDLEVYSDDPEDISNMEYHTFKAAYGRIILKSVERLKDNRFACFVVGDFRDKKGFYRNFVSDTIAAFEAAGARLYNEAILINPTGTAAMRANRQFSAGRKLVKLHQNVLVFCKGDWRKATKAAKGEIN